MRFQKHYSLEEARAMLPQVQEWLLAFSELRRQFETRDAEIATMTAKGADVGGKFSEGWVRTLSEMKEVLNLFQKNEIQLKDLDRGLVDFPAIVNGQEVFLCWERGEPDIAFWHDLDSGYAGRMPL